MSPSGLITRGVVLYPSDLSWAEWPDRAAAAGLTTLALHDGASPNALSRFIVTPHGVAFLQRCGALGLHVEYEIHAASELLPRAHFATDPELFRMNSEGERTDDANLCVHSERALSIVDEIAAAIAQHLRPTTGRYFLWGADGHDWCRCPSCKGLSDSDQALILENRLLAALRLGDAYATVAHLAYLNTMAPPTQIKPEPGVFLEFAPIRRDHLTPFARQARSAMAESLDMLDDNLALFGAEGAQVLEYWLDVSLFSKWQRLSTRLPWDRDRFESDLAAYAERRVRNITAFAAHIDGDYVAKFGPPPLDEYADGLSRCLTAA